MIDRFHITNFKCLEDVTIDFEPLTVLVGPNDSGKTSVLEGLGILRRVLTERMSEHAWLPSQDAVRHGGEPVSLSISSDSGEYSASLAADGLVEESCESPAGFGWFGSVAGPGDLWGFELPARYASASIGYNSREENSWVRGHTDKWLASAPYRLSPASLRLPSSARPR